ncbi:FAD/NAD(P)-binding protein [Kaistia dalseonensis]|uniref:NAD(P)/FAD-binding protein YdhS n=1 Tax=Kaistia dalseonensis TaxID=410840 RepID=A0ABU0H1U9_9HYPH|nr:FAD/NAD(P)-binding protein [Kaistia dalseonensis]MCX5493716.1 FAD/NAD(P)-binding protein [Kaistia dalseonensis]MDQ0436280.1 putative NAD(P)/FAD-binding protein YdhS [Kaistia dalseonensis]
MDGDTISAKRSRIVIIGGGFSGSLFAIKLAAADPLADIVLVERNEIAGHGLAYGACQPIHLLNVPVHRMELGLAPSFTNWLTSHAPAELDAVLEEAGGELAQAFVSRAAFGAYLRERLEAATARNGGTGIRRVRGEAVGLSEQPERAVLLADGRSLPADRVILATGNLPPKAPRSRDDWFYDSPLFVGDPWAASALSSVPDDGAVLLIGTGLTMVDVALALTETGHSGPILALSRRGLLPKAHRAGGHWAPFLDEAMTATPLRAMKAVRAQAAEAEAAGIPWQRVMDAARPAVARVWSGWNERQRASFLRHARPYWDVHRHRMAPRIAAGLDALLSSGRLGVQAGRLRGFHEADGRVTVTIGRRGQFRTEQRDFARVINCTGPRSDFDTIGLPLYAALRERGHIKADALGLGIETADCAIIDRSGTGSRWLHALGPLTRPAWWEVTAVPEIAAQVARLVDELARADRGEPEDLLTRTALATEFFDLGAGI